MDKREVAKTQGYSKTPSRGEVGGYDVPFSLRSYNLGRVRGGWFDVLRAIEIIGSFAQKVKNIRFWSSTKRKPPYAYVEGYGSYNYHESLYFV